MKVIAHDPYLDPEKIRAAGAEPVDFDTLLAQSDFLSCHCPLTPSTRHWIDRRALAKMKKSACLINTSRGGLICEADLIDALRSGVIAGAGLDVFETEPLPKDSPLRGMPQLLLTGHAAWYSEEARSSLQRMAAEEAARVLTGTPREAPSTVSCSGKALAGWEPNSCKKPPCRGNFHPMAWPALSAAFKRGRGDAVRRL